MALVSFLSGGYNLHRFSDAIGLVCLWDNSQLYVLINNQRLDIFALTSNTKQLMINLQKYTF